MLEVHGLSHSYGRHEALRDVSVRLRAGEVVAILGANGAGKTTLLNAIAGLIRPEFRLHPVSTAKSWPGCRPTGSSISGSRPCRRTGVCSTRCR